MSGIASAAVVGLALLAWSFRMQREVRRPPRCGKCVYSMENLEKLECPECGHRVASLEEWRVHRPKWGRRVMRGVAAVMLVWVVWMLSYVVGFVAERGRIVKLGLDRADNFKSMPFGGIPAGTKWEPNAQLGWDRLYFGGSFCDYLAPVPWSFRIHRAVVFAPVTDKDMEAICAFPMLEYLQLDGSRLTDAGFAQLKNARAVTELHLGWDFHIDDHTLEFLADMPALSKLELIGPRRSKFGGGGQINGFVRGPGLASLKRARSLKEIRLTNCEIIGDNIRFLAEVPHLEFLDLSNTKFSDEGLENFKLARSLKTLNLRETDTGDNGVLFLGAIPGIETLDLSSTKIKGPGLAGLKNAKTLKSLSLYDNDLGDDCVQFLAEIPCLESLTLQGPKITSVGISALKNAPALRVLSLYETSVNDDSLGALADIRTLTQLPHGDL